MRISPGELAEALGMPPPTEEQAAVIAAPPGPTLVVAGAGAGKTETMAARVVWMVANGLVAPDAVLGLTFTRKAAQQLTTRIRTRLARLAGAALLRELDPSGRLRARLTAAEPEISTYHSYAGRLLSEHGLLLPVEPNATLLTETQLWQLAHRVVTGWDGDLDTDRTPVSVTEAVLALSGQLAEHLVEPEQLAEAHTELEKLILTLPKGPRQRGGPSRELLGLLAVQHERVALLPLVQRLAEELRRRGALDFGAQMSLAARLAAEHPEVGAAERDRFRLVLLDEYQDTGHAQRILLAALFGDLDSARGTAPPGSAEQHPDSGRWPDPDRSRLAVTAVGDPMQSIYGWRGASAANLPRFATDFPSAPGVPAPILPLLTSWRNPPEALDLANLVAEPLRHTESGVSVDALRPRPDATAGTVALALLETVAAEREWVAERIAAEWEAHADAGAPPPTSAVLVRRNADAAPLAEALRERGLPVEIVGLGGLLATAEVADVVATLRLIADPAAGSAAMRILTGARWRLGISDLAALARRARDLSITPPPDESAAITDTAGLAAALRAVAPEPAERAGLADAIADPGAAEQYSPAGYQRIVTLSRELSALRERAGQSLPELVADVERTIGVGVETQARRASAGGGAGREHLDAFAEVVAGYASDHRASLPGLLAFLAAAEEVENGLEPGEVEVARDRVQVLTVHAAKGLEWEVVAVPHVVRGVFPSGTAAGTWLGALAELPTALRGDRQREDAPDGVPVLDLADLYDRSDLEQAIKAHKDALNRRRLDEERRLFYVALTRTERALFVSAHHWAETGAAPKGPSDFLLDLKHATEHPDSALPTAVRIDDWADPPSTDDVNPFTDNPASAEWPRDPLGKRRDAVQQGAALVRDALRESPDGATTFAPEPDGAEPAGQLALFGEFEVDEPDSRPEDIPGPEDDDPEGWAEDVDALLAEHFAATDGIREVELPEQLPATALVELRADPAKLAARLRRPLPYPPSPFARRGTAFHAWVQRWFGATRLLDLDELPGAADSGADDAELVRMQEAFLSSPWADRNPVEVEVAFETSLAGTLIRGRMDAVFTEPDGRWLVLDWKTGAEPTRAEEESVAMQLAVYRLAWARLMSARTGAPESDMLARTSAAFHYIRTGRTISPPTLPGPEELETLLRTAGNPWTSQPND
ncbi:UvrD-helicase domain-containing protein [Nocardia terpenica]|uniref:ATP-dependent helicase n=1 Tax=Nocardia terpenica TaxID=455432 RepID=UPI0018948D79|nr:UvrD-helicase domain-containing protein [Nocardia terpenica]MBF6063242.1 UvrD-helicase domain-containing protein [Nocardia terpenica]MBF6105798.1 UvrD-helicase domain-containing protein [Nocardia terpenica]MBF6113618.1 UvrD-helicase domain-containing protein [Nocardia terpenica]MBF6119539.1 UvrD-helicase domain-containing protein [Nocardia terpenica]MBF6151950.1 UvrD-helicase domain-containing protein [Nocardia terpenica]